MTADASGRPDPSQDDLTDDGAAARQALVAQAIQELLTVAAEPTAVEQLAHVHAALQALGEAADELGFAARDEGASWREIGEVTGRTKQSAQEYWARLQRLREARSDAEQGQVAAAAVRTTGRSGRTVVEDVRLALPGVPWAVVRLEVQRRRSRPR